MLKAFSRDTCKVYAQNSLSEKEREKKSLFESEKVGVAMKIFNIFHSRM